MSAIERHYALSLALTFVWPLNLSPSRSFRFMPDSNPRNKTVMMGNVP